MTEERASAPITDNELQAYVDGSLAQDRKAEIDVRLAQDPRLASRVAVWARQNETVRELYEHIALEDVPARLSVYRIDRQIRAERNSSWRMAAAAVLLVAVSGTSGWFGRAFLTGVSTSHFSLVSEAVAAHTLYAREIVHPVEVNADHEQHLTAWLSKRLDRSLAIPDLKSEGLSLLGGRLLPANGGPAAQLMYEDGAGKRVTLFVVPSTNKQEGALKYASEGSLNSFTWTDNAVTCTIVGGLPREQLQKIAAAAYAQFE